MQLAAWAAGFGVGSAEGESASGDSKSEEVDEVCRGVVRVAKFARIVGLRWFRGEDRGGEITG